MLSWGFFVYADTTVIVQLGCQWPLQTTRRSFDEVTCKLSFLSNFALFVHAVDVSMMSQMNVSMLH